MKAPDKIYLNAKNGDFGFAIWSKEEFPEFDTEQYIHKEALVKWARERWLYLRNRTLADRIRSSAFEEIFKHIESL